MASSGVPSPEASASLEAAVAELWGAYVWLRDNDIASSGTHKLLQQADAAYLSARLAGELEELTGVITGKHRHNGLPADLILEGSQVLYWTILLALVKGVEYHVLQPCKAMIAGASSTGGGLAVLSIEGRMYRLARKIRGGAVQDPGPLQEALDALGECCALHSMEVAEVVSHDLEAMRARSYLQPYFEAAGRG